MRCGEISDGDRGVCKCASFEKASLWDLRTGWVKGDGAPPGNDPRSRPLEPWI